MPRKWSVEYIDKLLGGNEYGDLVDLSSAICSSHKFSLELPDYGLPLSAFVFVEALCWFAQSIRSAAWTYYEATPAARQHMMHTALQQFAPTGFADAYAEGMRNWEDESLMEAVDEWINANDATANDWLRSHANSNRAIMLELTA